MAKQILHQLPEVASAQALDQTLLQVPSTLEALYTLTTQQIIEQAEDDAKLGRRVLSELLVAPQPMPAETLLDAVAGDVGWEKTYDPVLIEERINRCVRCCRDLITRTEGDIILFTHRTVKEYLEVHGIPGTST